MASEAGKAERFLAHLEPLQGALEGFCRRNLNDPNSVEDVLQSALANAYRGFHLYVENTNFRAWMFRYLTWEIHNWNRRAPQTTGVRLPEVMEASGSWEAIISDLALQAMLESPESVLQKCEDEIARAIRDLPVVERSVLLLRAIGDFRYREIAEILEIPIGSVMGYLGRARAKLRNRLAEYCRAQGLIRENSD